MLIDTLDKTVIFRQDEILTVDDLWILIDLLDDDLDTGKTFTDPLPGISGIYERYSDNKDYKYVVVVEENGDVSCSCPDWIHRRSHRNLWCKHILSLHLIGVF